jgi:hypothetical protein
VRTEWQIFAERTPLISFSRGFSWVFGHRADRGANLRVRAKYTKEAWPDFRLISSLLAVPRTRPKKGCLKDVDTGEIPVLCDISESTVREPFIDLRRARIALRQHWPLARMRARPPTFLSDGKMGLSTEVRLPARVKWRSTNGSMRSRRVAMYLRTASWTIAQASSCCARSVIFKN